ncbi:MAG: hypothetical protein NTX50_01000 [Candidatus Sumerlaeota bacterium]|nr:hypothetical protein [Candidatus Sumerlaeota bacterium]
MDLSKILMQEEQIHADRSERQLLEYGGSPPSFWRFNSLGAKKKAASHLTPKAGTASIRIAFVP